MIKLGVAKKVAIGILAVVVVLVVFWIVGSTATVVSERSKYEGLTEDQIDRIKIIYEQCETSAYLSGAGSDTAIKQNLERCAALEAQLIEKYRAE